MHSQKSAYNSWFPNNLTTVSFSISRGLVPGPLLILKSLDAQVPHIKQCRTMHIVSPLHPHIPSHGLKLLFSIRNCLNLRTRNQGIQRADHIFFFFLKSPYKWTWAVKTHVIQGSAVVAPFSTSSSSVWEFYFFHIFPMVGLVCLFNS